MIATSILKRLHAEVRAAHPRECCGILLGEGGRITGAVAASNVHATPETHFEIDPQALIDAHRAAREGGPQIIGYYHSHPNGHAEPSETDRTMAVSDGSIWAIVAGEEVTFWQLKETEKGRSRFQPVPFKICS